MAAFVFGFWILDVANNMTQGPCRALLADLTGNPPLPFLLFYIVPFYLSVARFFNGKSNLIRPSKAMCQFVSVR